jgi:hypothetical protein
LPVRRRRKKVLLRRRQIADGTLDVSESVGTASYANPFNTEEEIFFDTETRHTNETDDYEFLDEDDKVVDEVGSS